MNFFYMDKLSDRVYQTGEIDSCWVLRWFPVYIVAWCCIILLTGGFITLVAYPYTYLFGIAKFDVAMLIIGLVVNLLLYTLGFIVLDNHLNLGIRNKIGDTASRWSQSVASKSPDFSGFLEIISAIAHKACIKVKVENNAED